MSSFPQLSALCSVLPVFFAFYRPGGLVLCQWVGHWCSRTLLMQANPFCSVQEIKSNSPFTGRGFERQYMLDQRGVLTFTDDRGNPCAWADPSAVERFYQRYIRQSGFLSRPLVSVDVASPAPDLCFGRGSIPGAYPYEPSLTGLKPLHCQEAIHLVLQKVVCWLIAWKMVAGLSVWMLEILPYSSRRYDHHSRAHFLNITKLE